MSFKQTNIKLIKAQDPDTDWWDVDSTTSKALRDWNGLVKNSNGQLTKLAGEWCERGKKINSLEDLILCYYSGFKIICLPAARVYQPSLIKSQYDKLYHEIKEASDKSWTKRKSSGFLMAAEELEHYLEFCFDHFSKHPTTPFNFLSAACMYNPVSTAFEDHITRLVRHFVDCYPTDTGKQLFGRVAPYVASCILLDSYRQRYPGRGKCISLTSKKYARHISKNFRDILSS